MIKEVLVDRHLDCLKTKTADQKNICPVERLADVLDRSPFTSSRPIHTFCDLDGTVLFFSNKRGANFSSLLALGKIAKSSQELTLWSLRVKTSDNFFPQIFDQKSISYPPIINDRSLLRLKKFFSTTAPQTEINFNLGLGKLAKEGLLPQVNQTLNDSYQEIALIGSSVFDRLEMGKLLKKLPKERKDRLWYFDTGKIIF